MRLQLQVHRCPTELGSSSCTPVLQHPREDYSLFSLSYHRKISGLSLIQEKLMLLSKIRLPSSAARWSQPRDWSWKR